MSRGRRSVRTDLPHGNEVFPDTEFVREYGRTHTETRLSFSGKQPAVPESPFEDYVLEVSAVRNDFMLGYTLYTYTFTEVHTAEKRTTARKTK